MDGGDAGSLKAVPNLYLVVPINKEWTFGVGLNAPFGLITEYDDGWIGRYQAIKSDVRAMLARMPFVEAKVADPQFMQGVAYQAPINVYVRGDDMKELQRISDDLSRKAEESQAQLKQFGDQTADLKNSVDKALTEQAKFQTLEARLREVEQAADRKPSGDERLASVGNQLIQSEELKGFKLSTRNSTLRVPVKMALYSAGLADNIVAPERDPAIVPRLKQRLFVRDLIPAGRTTSPGMPNG